MKRWTLVSLAVVLGSCTGVATPPRQLAGDALPKPSDFTDPQPVMTLQEVDLENYGLAPELENEVWLNTDQPLRLAELRGKVVLIEMWTFG